MESDSPVIERDQAVTPSGESFSQLNGIERPQLGYNCAMGLFAILAAAVWLLAAFGVALGSVNMLLLGLALLGVHFAFEFVIPLGGRRRE